MEKKFLLIGNQDDMTVKSFIELMQSKSFFVHGVPGNANEIHGIESSFKVIFLYVEKFAQDIAAIVATRDIALKMEAKVCFCAEEDEIESVKQIIDKEVFLKSFSRPSDVTVYVEEMCKVFDRLDDDVSIKNILIVDDDGVILRRMKSCLQDTYNVYIVNSGMTAIALLAQKKIDLILLDYEMPVMSGEQLYALLKANPETSKIPVMFLTGVNDKNIVMKIIGLKPEGYLLKSMSADQLTEKIGEYFYTHS